MKKRIIISESEKKTILGLYGLLKEDPSDTQKYKNDSDENKTKNDSDESITISGIVKQGTIDGKKGVVDATVTIEEKDDENNSKSVETDGNGAFKIVLPYVGKYKVTVEKKGFQSYSKTFNFNDDVNFNIPLTPKKGIIPNIKRKVQNIIDKLKDYYDTRDPKEETAIIFTEYSNYREKDIWEESESQQEYCRNFTEYYYNFIIGTNSDTKNAEQANSWAPDDEKLNQAKNFIMFCKKQYGNKLFASSIETKRKFDKIFTTLQNLPPKVKRYEI